MMAFMTLHYAALFMLVFMMRHARRYWFHSSPPVGRRTLKRMRLQTPHVLGRLQRRCAETNAAIHCFSSWMQSRMSFFSISYGYYSGMCSTTWTGWFVAAVCVSDSSLRPHASTYLGCQHMSFYLHCLMAEISNFMSFLSGFL